MNPKKPAAASVIHIGKADERQISSSDEAHAQFMRDVPSREQRANGQSEHRESATAPGPPCEGEAGLLTASGANSSATSMGGGGASGERELTFLGDPFEGLGRALDPVLAVVAFRRQQADDFVRAAGSRARNVAGREQYARSNGEFVLQHPLHYSNNACLAHGPTAMAGRKPSKLYSTHAAFLASLIRAWQHTNLEVFSGR
jgi:hypothetical protein